MSQGVIRSKCEGGKPNQTKANQTTKQTKNKKNQNQPNKLKELPPKGRKKEKNVWILKAKLNVGHILSIQQIKYLNFHWVTNYQNKLSLKTIAIV